MPVHRGKMQEVGRDCHGGLEGIMWRNRREGIGARCDMDGNTQAETKKTNNGAKRNENEQVQICLTRYFTKQKQQSRNEPKQTSRKDRIRQNKEQAAKKN